jgi:hypothetical protein
VFGEGVQDVFISALHVDVTRRLHRRPERFTRQSGRRRFNYDAASDTFTPATETNQPPQANDAKCGFACHSVAQKNDYVFTAINLAERGHVPAHAADMIFRRYPPGHPGGTRRSGHRARL